MVSKLFLTKLVLFVLCPSTFTRGWDGALLSPVFVL